MDELEQQTREVLDGKPPTQNIFPFQVRTKGRLRASGGCLEMTTEIHRLVLA